MQEIGEVTVFHKGDEMDVEWKIPDIDTLSKEIDVEYYSPGSFFFKGEDWCLEMIPNGSEYTNSVGYIDVGLLRNSLGFPIPIDFSFSLKTVKGENNLKRQETRVFYEDEGSHSIERFLLREEYEIRKSEWLSPSGSLTILCTLKMSTENEMDFSSNDDLSESSSCYNEEEMMPTPPQKECFHCNEAVDAEEISVHEKKCRIKCPECLDIVLLKNWKNHECQIPRAEAFEKRMHDNKALMLSGDHSDVIVKVKEVEFRLHKCILTAHNPYFNAMFKNDMKEKSTGVVRIEDCDPSVFHSFIHFVYTGEIDELSSKTVCELYEAADKYQEDILKKECLQFLLNNFSFDCFCDYFILAMRHDEEELLQKAVEFFVREQKEITCTVQWQTFVEENPAQADELLLKTLDHCDK